ncbi:hypothetical protein BOTBODRAFT_640759 [Botryobasidium botryosum FD-172 SS1]|uniref:Ribonuclease H1 N-terminal domain-containing protein n=1 Tax=Botryobasidium botryosum (strain FD-172 SS1) TaxID=930990 RepID=A0A067M2Q5_BOTB1|nr:hypothetical protein BOTBODRAFT_640759 [Botryobasidium botryosum FD-172 SS1]
MSQLPHSPQASPPPSGMPAVPTGAWISGQQVIVDRAPIGGRRAGTHYLPDSHQQSVLDPALISLLSACVCTTLLMHQMPGPDCLEERRPYYPVARGRVPGIYRTWEEAAKQVLHFAGAIYRRVGSLAKAMAVMEMYAAPASPVVMSGVGELVGSVNNLRLEQAPPLPSPSQPPPAYSAELPPHPKPQAAATSSTSSDPLRNLNTAVCVHHNIRDLGGITRVVTIAEYEAGSGALNELHEYPDLGVFADSYIQAQGFDLPSARSIHAAYNNSSARVHFLADLISQGMAQLKILCNAPLALGVENHSYTTPEMNADIPSSVSQPLTPTISRKNPSKSQQGVKCLASQKTSTNIPRKKHRTRTKSVSQKTPTEKRIAAAKRQKERQEYVQERQVGREKMQAHAEYLHTKFGAHSVTWYMEDMLQQYRLDKQKRGVNCWNAYVAQETKRINEEREGQGATRLSLEAVVKEIQPEWNAMTKDERKAATVDAVAEIEETREMKLLAVQNLPINAFNDVRANVQAMENASTALHARTGAIGLSLWVRSKDCALNAPYSYTTCGKAEEFLNNVYGVTVAEFSSKFEAYCLSGMEGVKKSNAKELLELKVKTRVLIEAKLATAAGVDKVRMVYGNFGQHVTAKYGLVIDNWPLPRFCSPSDIGSAMEVNILFNAWKNDVAKFRKLSPSELAAWFAARAQDSVVAAAAPPAAANSATPAPVTTPTPTSSTPDASLSTAPSAAPPAPPRKARKIRSDKGKPKPRKKKSAQAKGSDAAVDASGGAAPSQNVMGELAT